MFDLAGLASAIAVHGPVARVVIAGFEGSSPREVGTAMLVWDKGQSGTIGGGALEFEAAAKARALLAAFPAASIPSDDKDAARMVERVALGPSLGQCCGGAVTLWTEVYDQVPKAVAGVITDCP